MGACHPCAICSACGAWMTLAHGRLWNMPGRQGTKPPPFHRYNNGEAKSTVTYAKCGCTKWVTLPGSRVQPGHNTISSSTPWRQLEENQWARPIAWGFHRSRGRYRARLATNYPWRPHIKQHLALSSTRPSPQISMLGSCSVCPLDLVDTETNCNI